ncbi:MSCRAMM family protein [Prauserella rugosa]|nr:carboxypeptidase regulatory-like domain-containing protein [Prauserella rugosa]
MRNEFPAWPQEEPPASNGTGLPVNGLARNGTGGGVGESHSDAYADLEVTANDVLSGVVHGGHRPLAEVTVTVTDRTGSQCARATTDANGVFRVPGLEPGSYVLVFARAGYRPQATVVPPGAVPSRLDITLEPTAGVRGTVRDRIAGRPIPGATVTAIGENGEVIGSSVSDEDGAYLLGGVHAAQITLVAAAPLADPIATVVALDGPATDVDLELELRGALTGVLTSGGWPLSGVRLLLRNGDGAVVSSTVSDDAGRYRFGSVVPGAYTVTTAPPEPAVVTVGPHSTLADLPVGVGQGAVDSDPVAPGTAARDGRQGPNPPLPLPRRG